MTMEEIAEMYDVNLETCNNNKNDNQQRYAGKTASSPYSTANNSLWFLDVFESNY